MGTSMNTLNTAEAGSEFGGEDVVISKYGRPVAMIVPFHPPVESKDTSHAPRRDWRDELGLRNPNFKLDPHFDDPMDDLWEVFDDNAEEPTP